MKMRDGNDRMSEDDIHENMMRELEQARIINDLTDDDVVIDDMDPKIKPISPHRYAVTATEDPTNADVVRVELSRIMEPEFLCSYDDVGAARGYANKLTESTLHLNDRAWRIPAVTQLIETIGMDDLHGITMGVLSTTGYSQHHEFQSLIFEYDQYMAAGYATPFTLSAALYELRKINRLASLYITIFDQLRISVMIDVTPDELAETLIRIIDRYRSER